jgi:hypothetical protein
MKNDIELRNGKIATKPCGEFSYVLKYVYMWFIIQDAMESQVLLVYLVCLDLKDNQVFLELQGEKAIVVPLESLACLEHHHEKTNMADLDFLLRNKAIEK